MSKDKIRVMTLGDMPLSPSGVGTQSKYMIEGLLKTGNYSFFSLGGAIKHENYDIKKTEKWGDDWQLQPVDGFGNPEIVRSLIRYQRPDIIWLMTDPRFWPWLWNMEDEIRPLCPMVYYHVWDNYPYPNYNKRFYDSNDAVVTISKVTDDIVRTVSPDVECFYLPHAVESDIYTKLEEKKVSELKKGNFPLWENDKFLIFWNNRNARRKQSGTLIWWFKEFLDEVGHDKACLLMHTEPSDSNGPNLQAVIEELGLVNGEVMFSTKKIVPQELAFMYNMADVTVNISDAEGFGLGTLESLSCGTPIVVTMTGGLQQQVTDGKNWFGVGLKPASTVVIGSQDVPYIHEDRVSKEDFIVALKKIFNLSKKERNKMGEMGRQHVLKNYNFENYEKGWDKIMTHVHKKNGSWQTRKNYKSWTFKEVA